VRELENAVERAVVLSRGNLITPDHLPFGDAREARDRARLSARVRVGSSVKGNDQTDGASDADDAATDAAATNGASDGAATDGATQGGFKEAVADLEKRLIRDALDRAGGNRSKAAEELGIYRRLLYAKIREYGIGE
jgi:DNA-binding NtrC family response regulator